MLFRWGGGPVRSQVRGEGEGGVTCLVPNPVGGPLVPGLGGGGVPRSSWGPLIPGLGGGPLVPGPGGIP